MGKIIINRPVVPKIEATGMALDAILFADAYADLYWNNISHIAKVLEEVLNIDKPVNALRLKEAWAILCGLKEAEKPTGNLAQRHRATTPTYSRDKWPICDGEMADNAESAIRYASYRYYCKLEFAGVPMPKNDIYNAQYWEVAASMGC